MWESSDFTKNIIFSRSSIKSHFIRIVPVQQWSIFYEVLNRMLQKFKIHHIAWRVAALNILKCRYPPSKENVTMYSTIIKLRYFNLYCQVNSSFWMIFKELIQGKLRWSCTSSPISVEFMPQVSLAPSILVIYSLLVSDQPVKCLCNSNNGTAANNRFVGWLRNYIFLYKKCSIRDSSKWWRIVTEIQQ